MKKISWGDKGTVGVTRLPWVEMRVKKYHGNEKVLRVDNSMVG